MSKFRGVHFEEAVVLTLIERDALIKSQMICLLEYALTRTWHPEYTLKPWKPATYGSDHPLVLRAPVTSAPIEEIQDI